MKQFFICLSCALLVTGAAAAQRRFKAGVRAGINTTSYTFSRLGAGGTEFSPGQAKAGYEAGFVLRYDITRHLLVQTELDFSFVNYAYRLRGATDRNISMRTERFDIPLLLGLRLGPVRLFGGARFPVSESGHSSVPRLLEVDYSRKVGITGGVGFDIRRFFFDFRISGYGRSHVWDTFTTDGVAYRVKVPRNIVYGGSIGFFF